jgi:hypothetical protein
MKETLTERINRAIRRMFQKVVVAGAAVALTYNFFVGVVFAQEPYKTGQTISYTANDDGQTKRGKAWANPRFTPGNGIITDNNTGLQFLTDANCVKTNYSKTFDRDGAVSQQKAQEFVNGMNTGTYASCNPAGATDWRLPTAEEIANLKNYGQSMPQWLNTQGFTNVQAKNYMTSDSTKIIGKKGAITTVPITVNMANNTTETASEGFLLPLRGAVQEPVDQRFYDNGNFMIDLKTGLSWPKNADEGKAICPRGDTLNWSQASQHVDGLNTNNYQGFNNCAVPNANELASLFSNSDAA